MNVEALRQLWPNGIQPADYQRVIGVVGGWYGTQQEATHPTATRTVSTRGNTPRNRTQRAGMTQPELVVQAIRQGKTQVADIAKATGIPRAQASSILSKLTKRGVLTTEKQGRQTSYGVRNGAASEALAH